MTEREEFESFLRAAQPDGGLVSFRRDDRDGGPYFYPGVEKLWQQWAARSTPKQGEAADPHAPKEIFLQLYGDSSADEGPVDYEAGDVSWCWHKVFDSDVRYVQAATTEPKP